MQNQASIQVLVVEDEDVNRDVVCEMLRHFGHEVSAVHGGHAALAAMQDGRFDAVVMDCRMDDMDGLETTRRLRAGEGGDQGRWVPVVALTAQAFAADRAACLAAGMDDFLTKPVEVGDLIRTVVHWANRAHRGGQAFRGRHGHGPGGACVDTAHRPANHGGAPCHDARERHGLHRGFAPTAPQTLPGELLAEARHDDDHDATPTTPYCPSVLQALPMVADGSQPEYGQVVLKLYLKSLPKLLALIRQATLGGDTHGALHAVHSLKSSSAAVGALALSACAARAEARLRTGHAVITDMGELPDRLEHERDRLLAAIEAELPPAPPAPSVPPVSTPSPFSSHKAEQAC